MKGILDPFTEIDSINASFSRKNYAFGFWGRKIQASESKKMASKKASKSKPTPEQTQDLSSKKKEQSYLHM